MKDTTKDDLRRSFGFIVLGRTCEIVEEFFARKVAGEDPDEE